MAYPEIDSFVLCSNGKAKQAIKVDPFDKQEVKAILDATHHEQIKNLFQFALMVMRTYGKWIPDDSSKKGYQPLNNWGAYIGTKNGD